jgi:hypothetical protein
LAEPDVAAFYKNVLEEYQIELVLCGTDKHLRFFRDLIDENYLPTRLCAPSKGTLHLLQCKVQAREYFRSMNAPIPRGTSYKFNPTPKIEANQLKFPIVIKRSLSEGTSAVRLTKSKAELELEIRKSLLLRQDFVLEEYLGKTDEVSVQFFVERSEVYLLYGLKKLSHLAPSFSTCVESLSAYELTEMVKPFRRAFEGLEDGLYSAQLKKTADGSLVIIEISCRLGNNFRIVSAMWPELTSAILDFYAGCASWKMKAQSICHKPPMLGMSLLEDLLGRVQKIIVRRDKNFWSRIYGETFDLCCILAKRPTWDDYMVNITSHPAPVLHYYFSVLREYFVEWKVRSRMLEFVSH